MLKVTLSKILSIYSVAYGALVFIGSIIILIDVKDINAAYVFSMLFGLTFLALGVIGVIKDFSSRPRAGGITIALFVLYCICQFMAFTLLLSALFLRYDASANLYGFLILEAIIIMPFIFGIMYLTRRVGDEPSNVQQQGNFGSPTLTQNILELKKMLDSGIIDEEQYKKTVDKLIGM